MSDRYCGKLIVRTLHSNDGVIGLNGYQYLLNADDSLMSFPSIEKAEKFLTKHGIDIELVEIIDFHTGELHVG